MAASTIAFPAPIAHSNKTSVFRFAVTLAIMCALSTICRIVLMFAPKPNADV